MTFFMSGMTLLIVGNEKNDTNGTSSVELRNDKDKMFAIVSITMTMIITLMLDPW